MHTTDTRSNRTQTSDLARRLTKHCLTVTAGAVVAASLTVVGQQPAAAQDDIGAPERAGRKVSVHTSGQLTAALPARCPAT